MLTRLQLGVYGAAQRGEGQRTLERSHDGKAVEATPPTSNHHRALNVPDLEGVHPLVMNAIPHEPQAENVIGVPRQPSMHRAG